MILNPLFAFVRLQAFWVITEKTKTTEIVTRFTCRSSCDNNINIIYINYYTLLFLRIYKNILIRNMYKEL